MHAHALRLYYLAVFAALGVYLPFFPRWLEARGIEGAAMGMVAAAFPAMSLVSPPLFGLLADALRLRRALLRAATAGAFTIFAGLAALSLTGASLGFLGLLFTVAAFSFFRSPMVLMADVLALEGAQAGGPPYGRVRLFGSLGFLLAVVAAGRLLDPRALAPLPIAIAATLLGALAVAFVLPTGGALPPRAVPGQLAGLLRDGDFRVFLACAFLGEAAQSSYNLCYSLHLRDLGASDTLVGAAWAIGVSFEVVLMSRDGRLFKDTPAPVALAIAQAIAALRWLLTGLLPSPVALLFLQPLHALSFALVWVTCLTYVRDRAPPGALATAQGLFSASFGLGAVTGMLTWGAVYGRAGGSTTFGAAALLSLAGCACALELRRRQGSSRQTHSAPTS